MSGTPNTSPSVPPMALRTYRAIRLGAVAVIAGLGFAVWRDIVNSPTNCVQRSLSAYFYTPVRPVFVGAMLIIGFAMIVLWGKTVVEDNGFNLAGLLLIVVAFVPTLDANYCSLPASVGGRVSSGNTSQISDDKLIQANAATVTRSFSSLLVVLWLLLIFIAIAAAVTYWHSSQRPHQRQGVVADLITWGLALVATVIYSLLYLNADDPHSAFNHSVHGWSANIAVVLVIVVVASAGWRKRRESSENAVERKWARLYGGVAVMMMVAIAVFKGGEWSGMFDGWLADHVTFLLEATLVTLIGVFWTLQTIDRRNEGAPPRGTVPPLL